MNKPAIIRTDGSTTPVPITQRPGNSEVKYSSMDAAFPPCKAGMRPIGSCVLVQIRQSARSSDGGIIYVDYTKAAESDNTQVGKVIAMGPLAFKSILEGKRGPDGEETEYLADWPGGPQFGMGEFVRVPKYGGDRYPVKASITAMEVNPETGHREPVTRQEEVVFAIFKAKDVLGVIDEASVLTLKAYLDNRE